MDKPKKNKKEELSIKKTQLFEALVQTHKIIKILQKEEDRLTAEYHKVEEKIWKL